MISFICAITPQAGIVLGVLAAVVLAGILVWLIACYLVAPRIDERRYR
jgi:hypothetical protein